MKSIDRAVPAPGPPREVVTLGEDEYYVLGDNVPVSYDSRYEPLSRLPGSAISRLRL